MTPAALVAALGVAVRVAFKAFEDVVGAQAQLGGAPGRSNGAHTAAAQQQQFFITGYSLDGSIKFGVWGHAGPLFPGYGNSAGNIAHPFAFSVAAHVHQHGVVGLPPRIGQGVADVASVAFGGFDRFCAGVGGCGVGVLGRVHGVNDVLQGLSRKAGGAMAWQCSHLSVVRSEE